MKFGFVTIYGKANAGKSTLLNCILKTKFFAVSNRPQTTRENILGIYNDDESQIVFIDTPGIFKPHAKLGANLLRNAENAKFESDIVVFVFAANEGIDKKLIESLQKVEVPIIIAYNKIDLVQLEEGENKLKKLTKLLPDSKVVRMSAKEGFGIDELINLIKDELDEGERMYPTDIISDRPIEFLYTEFIREKCMRLLKDEIPHAIYIEYKDKEESDEGITIYANILVEKESEKAIVIGKNGSMISKISKYSEAAIEGFIRKPVVVKLLVKVKENWRNDPRFLNSHGLGK